MCGRAPILHMPLSLFNIPFCNSYHTSPKDVGGSVPRNASFNASEKPAHETTTNHYLYDSSIFYCCLLHYDCDSCSDVEPIFWSICFLYALQINHSSLYGCTKVLRTRKLLTDIYAYIFVRDDNIFPDLCILVNNTVPLTKITSNKFTIINRFAMHKY